MCDEKVVPGRSRSSATTVFMAGLLLSRARVDCLTLVSVRLSVASLLVRLHLACLLSTFLVDMVSSTDLHFFRRASWRFCECHGLHLGLCHEDKEVWTVVETSALEERTRRQPGHCCSSPEAWERSLSTYWGFGISVRCGLKRRGQTRAEF